LEGARHLTEHRWWGGAVTRRCPAIVTDGAEPATRAYAPGGRPDDPDSRVYPALGVSRWSRLRSRLQPLDERRKVSAEPL
jgi:hypothetical protein